ncbi:MAG: phosphatase PAP2 family protein [Alphaproteobacteria bacterium]|nr:phosphatase PAP2 family protein [Alphaproteobacteria bacterium]
MVLRHWVSGVALALLIGAAGAAQTLPADKPAVVHLLTPAEVNPQGLLPPPPREGSTEQKAELAELHRIQDARTPADLAQAEWDNAHEDPSAFAATLGPRFDMAKLPATARLLLTIEHEQSAAKKLAKVAFHRPRPWVLDPTLVGCAHADDKPNSSYPSGHTTMAFAMAVTLADLIPDRAGDIFARAQQYGQSRLVCGVHYRSDIIAGQVLGTAVGVELLHSPALRADLDAARQELHAAGIAP